MQDNLARGEISPETFRELLPRFGLSEAEMQELQEQLHLPKPGEKEDRENG